jgi:hypothetical protein
MHSARGRDRSSSATRSGAWDGSAYSESEWRRRSNRAKRGRRRRESLIYAGLVQLEVTEARLRELLAEQAESATLEFVGDCDLSNRRDVVELASEVGALAAAGGSIVIGVDDHGVPAGMLDARKVALFDEASLRSKLARDRLDEKLVVLIRVEPHPDGAAVFAADGAYEQDGKMRSAFRAGDIFVRHGTKSERPEQADIAHLTRAAVERAQVWQDDVARIEQAVLDIGDTARAEAESSPDGRLGGYGRVTKVPTVRRRLAARLSSLRAAGGPALPECQDLADGSQFVFYNQVISAVFAATDEIARVLEQQAAGAANG